MFKRREKVQRGLIRRLRYLWTFELFDSLFLPALAVWLARFLDQPLGVTSIYAMALTACILLQGALYWWMRLDGVKRQRRLVRSRFAAFAVLRGINWSLLGIGGVLLLLALLRIVPWASSMDGVVAFCFWVLALLEQINYYCWQLMYDCPSDGDYLRRQKRLRRASLAAILAGNRRSISTLRKR